ncbi:MAG: biotin--[acetyl-CoA-carboxylase] ligase [Omnitrophica WOR_2 bacterium RIFCSPHIGHO2_02_FULL_45_21]|nr:MAG: biotin--[acetyl-CoA-carboxylase] ligase [Omnitrophica WOR_2 bacterium RIFCSPHIGHO2_02_FULL_45_21]
MDEGIVRVFHSRRLDSLQTQGIGKKIYKYDTTGSTNDLAFMYALQGEKEGAVFWARAQTKGRGRQGRCWVSHKDKGIYFSIILKPDILVSDAPKITLLAALSICKALRKSSDGEFLLKWPNDIVIDDKKIGGILTEMNEKRGKIRFLIVGIGVNTNFKRSELPTKEAASLRILLEKEIDNEHILGLCLQEIDSHYAQFKKDGFSQIIDEARHLSSLWGKQVRINDSLEGVAVDFDEEGALLIRQANGFLEHIFAGDVKLMASDI